MGENTYQTMAMDGIMCMDEGSLSEYMFRALYQVCRAACQQLPATMQVSIDREQFLGAFKAMVNGKEHFATGWDLAPTGNVREPQDGWVERCQQIRNKVLVDLYEHHAPAIPTLKSNESPYRTTMEVGLAGAGRAKESRKRKASKMDGPRFNSSRGKQNSFGYLWHILMALRSSKEAEI